MEFPSVWIVKVIHQEFWITNSPGQGTHGNEAHTHVYSVTTLKGWNWTLEPECGMRKKITEGRIRMSHRALEKVDVIWCVVRRTARWKAWKGEARERQETMADTGPSRKPALGDNIAGVVSMCSFQRGWILSHWSAKQETEGCPSFLSLHRFYARPTESLQWDPTVSWMGNKNQGQLLGQITALRFHFYTVYT